MVRVKGVSGRTSRVASATVRDVERHLSWDGCWNARDLGGLRLRGGGETQRGAVVRSESLHLMSDGGWSSLRAHGIRTIVDLRNSRDRADVRQVPRAGVTTVAVALEEGLDDDAEFSRWREAGILSTPLYYRAFLRRWPERVGAAVAAVAGAEAGGVVVHCGKGCDRTGLVTLAILALVGVVEDDIIADYESTSQRLASPEARRLGRPDDNQVIEALLASERTTMAKVIRDTLALLDTEIGLREVLVSSEGLRQLRSRLVAPEGTAGCEQIVLG